MFCVLISSTFDIVLSVGPAIEVERLALSLCFQVRLELAVLLETELAEEEVVPFTLTLEDLVNSGSFPREGSPTGFFVTAQPVLGFLLTVRELDRVTG